MDECSSLLSLRDLRRAIPGLTWIERRHSTLCGLNGTGHRACTCEPQNVAHTRLRDVVKR